MISIARLVSARPYILLLGLSLAVLGAGCGGGTGDDAPDAKATAATPAPTAGVAFEPAFPADVSSEGLSEQDAAQQETPHSHDGGEEHTHGEEDDHEENEGDHGHPH